jgi:hypothetical protein
MTMSRFRISISIRTLVTASALAILLPSCSLLITGPSSTRKARAIPRCDTGKGLIYFDGAFAGLMGAISVGALVNSDSGGLKPGLVMGAISAIYIAAAVSANSSVNQCFSEFDKYGLEMSVMPAAQVAAGSSPARTGEVRIEASAPADMQENEDDIRSLARRYTDEAIIAQAAGHFDEAIALYNRAYALAPNTQLLFNLGQCHRLKGDEESALGYYLKHVAADGTSELAQESRLWIQELENHLRALDEVGKQITNSPGQ